MNKVLVDGQYGQLLGEALLRDGLISFSDYHTYLLNDSEAFVIDSDQYHFNVLKENNGLRQSLYRLFLLYPTINTIDHWDCRYDFSNLSIIEPMHPFPCLPSTTKFDVIDVRELKKPIVTAYCKSLNNEESIIIKKILGYTRLDSAVRCMLNNAYDYSVFKNSFKDHKRRVSSIVDIKYFNYHQRKLVNSIDSIIRRIHYYWQYGENHILQSHFKCSDFTHNKSELIEVQSTLETYQLLRINLEIHLNLMPRFKSFEEVFETLAHKKSEVSELRTQIQKLLNAYKKGNAKFINEFHNIYEDLSNQIWARRKLDKVSGWAGKLSLGALAMGLPITSTALGVSSSSAYLGSKYLNNKYKWIFVIR